MELDLSKSRFTHTNEEKNPSDIVLFDNNSSSSSFIASNCDILILILLLLPVKSLLTFKSVSKLWLSLISDPNFVQKYCLRNKHRLSIPGLFLQWSGGSTVKKVKFIFFGGDGDVPFKILPYHQRDADDDGDVPFKILPYHPGDDAVKRIQIVHSCNGLVLCRSGFTSLSHEEELAYYIYNPYSTSYLRILPSIPQSPFRTCPLSFTICSVSLAFNPLKSPHYEVVCIWRIDEERYQIDIYSSGTCSWRSCGDSFVAPTDLFNKSGVFWEGSLHWVSSNFIPESSLYFDVDQELVHKMPLPPIPEGHYLRIISYFGECRGHLYLIEMYDSYKTDFDILEMETDYSQWNIKYHVNLEGLASAYPMMVEYDSYTVGFTILLVEEKEQSTKLVLLTRPDGKVISYDLKEFSFKKLHDLKPFFHGSYDAYQCIESLACV